VLTHSRYGVGWDGLGQAADCYETALAYAGEREQFGQPIASFQLVQQKLVEMVNEISLAQLLSIHTGRLKDDGLLRVFRTSPPRWLAFHAAEVCGQERALPARDLGDLCLRASWVCRKEKEHPFESTFQLRAVRYFLRALEEEGLHGRELSLTTYLVGELNRRLGNHREALNWYVNAGRTTGGYPSLSWLDRLITQQSKLAKEQAA